jgi:hypothetical protein
MSVNQLRSEATTMTVLQKIKRQRLQRRLRTLAGWTICMALTAGLFFGAYELFGPAATLCLLPLGAGSGYLVGARLASIAPIPGATAVALAFALHQPGVQGHVSLTFAIGTAAILSLTSVGSGILFESLRRSGRLAKREATPQMLKIAGLDS